MVRNARNSLAVFVVAGLVLASGPAGADPFRSAVGTGLLGAGIGGIAGGGSGAAKGAAIGAGVGILAGGARQNRQQQQQQEQQARQQQEAEAARLRAEQERLALDRQRLEMEQQFQREREMMQQQQRQQQVAAPAPAPVPLQTVDSALIADIQRSLTILGFQPGPIDGILGASTVIAIKNYETSHGLLVTGQASHPLLEHMRARGG